MSPQHLPETTRRMFGLHVLLTIHFVDHQATHLEERHGTELSQEAVDVANRATQLLAKASISQLRGGRPCALRWPRGPHAHSLGLEAQRLPSSPPFAVAPRGSGAPLPARHTAFVGALRRKPPRLSGACATCRCAGSALDASLPSKVASCAARRQRRTLRLRLRSRLKSCGWGRTGDWTTPRPARLPRPCGGHAGAWRTFGSAMAPAQAARRPAGSGSDPSPRPSQGWERVAPCRHRGRSLRLRAPPNGERQVLRPRVKAEPFGWPRGQPGPGLLRATWREAHCDFSAAAHSSTLTA
jgi:hypothetical protein